MRKYIPVETKKETGRIYLGEIIYIEKQLRKAILVTRTREVAVYCAMEDIKQYTDERFLDCHRSYLFNMDKILRMESQVIYMEHGHHVTLGRESFTRGRRQFRTYLQRKNAEKMAEFPCNSKGIIV